MIKKKRLNIEIGQVTQIQLARLVKETENSQSEIIREAISLYDYFLSETNKGHKIKINDKEILIPKLRK